MGRWFDKVYTELVEVLTTGFRTTNWLEISASLGNSPYGRIIEYPELTLKQTQELLAIQI